MDLIQVLGQCKQITQSRRKIEWFFFVAKYPLFAINNDFWHLSLNTNSFNKHCIQNLLRSAEELETPLQDITSTSKYVLSYLRGSLQQTAAETLEQKLDHLEEQHKT